MSGCPPPVTTTPSVLGMSPARNCSGKCRSRPGGYPDASARTNRCPRTKRWSREHSRRWAILAPSESLPPSPGRSSHGCDAGTLRDSEPDEAGRLVRGHAFVNGPSARCDGCRSKGTFSCLLHRSGRVGAGAQPRSHRGAAISAPRSALSRRRRWLTAAPRSWAARRRSRRSSGSCGSPLGGLPGRGGALRHRCLCAPRRDHLG